MVTLMEHVLDSLGLLFAWSAYVYFRPRKRCRKCSGWGSKQRTRRKACGRCQGTGRTMRLSAVLVHHAAGIAKVQVQEAIAKRREAS
jgi:DnaJ-class molecular chaperone